MEGGEGFLYIGSDLWFFNVGNLVEMEGGEGFGELFFLGGGGFVFVIMLPCGIGDSFDACRLAGGFGFKRISAVDLERMPASFFGGALKTFFGPQ